MVKTRFYHFALMETRKHVTKIKKKWNIWEKKLANVKLEILKMKKEISEILNDHKSLETLERRLRERKQQQQLIEENEERNELKEACTYLDSNFYKLFRHLYYHTSLLPGKTEKWNTGRYTAPKYPALVEKLFNSLKDLLGTQSMENSICYDIYGKIDIYHRKMVSTFSFIIFF